MKKIFLFNFFLLFTISSFSQSRYISKTTKKIVFSRDGGNCNCCGSFVDLVYDHITPFSCGGSSDASNIQLLCQKCNQSKSNSCICKIHKRRIGTNCCEKNTINKSSSTSSQCTGTTKKGARCKNKATNSTGRCRLH